MSFFLNPGNLLRSPGLFPAAARAARAARAAPTAACALSAAELAHGLAQNQEHDDCQNRDDDDICHSPVLSNLAGSCGKSLRTVDSYPWQPLTPSLIMADSLPACN